MANEAKALRLLGLAVRAGRVTVGTPLTCEALKRPQARPVAVLLSADAAENTAKRITDRTHYYSVPLVRLQASSAALGAAIGKKDADVAVVGITDPHLGEAVRLALTAEEN